MTLVGPTVFAQASYEYDEYGRLVEGDYSLERSVTYGYDIQDNRTSVSMQDGADPNRNPSSLTKKATTPVNVTTDIPVEEIAFDIDGDDLKIDSAIIETGETDDATLEVLRGKTLRFKSSVSGEYHLRVSISDPKGGRLDSFLYITVTLGDEGGSAEVYKCEQGYIESPERQCSVSLNVEVDVDYQYTAERYWRDARWIDSALMASASQNCSVEWGVCSQLEPQSWGTQSCKTGAYINETSPSCERQLKVETDTDYKYQADAYWRTPYFTRREDYTVRVPYVDTITTQVQVPYTTTVRTPYQQAYQVDVRTPYQEAYQAAVQTPYQQAYQVAVQTQVRVPYTVPVTTSVRVPYTVTTRVPIQVPYTVPISYTVSIPYIVAVTTAVQVAYQKAEWRTRQVPVQQAVATTVRTPVRVAVQTPVPFFIDGFGSARGVRYVTTYVTQYVTKTVINYVTRYVTQAYRAVVTLYRTEHRTTNQTRYRNETRTRYETRYRTDYQTQTSTQYRTENRTSYETRYRTENRTSYQTRFRTAYRTTYETRYRTAYRIVPETRYRTEYRNETVTRYRTEDRTSQVTKYRDELRTRTIQVPGTPYWENSGQLTTLQRTPDCAVTSSYCAANGTGPGNCAQQRSVFRCEATVVGVPSVGTYTDVQRKYWTDGGSCAAYKNDSSCSLEAAPCLDGYDETRDVNGASVHSVCWRGRLDYTCTSQTPAPTCKILPPGAELVSTGCDQEIDGKCNVPISNYKYPLPKSSPNGCLTEQNAYRCEDKLMASFDGDITKTYRHEVSRSWEGMDACNAITDAGCTLTRAPCTDGHNETRTINGLEVASACWGGPRYYSCEGRSDIDTCDVPQGYVYVDQTCTAEDANGVCTLYEKTYEKG